MTHDTQRSLELTLSTSNTIEFIRHDDGHSWLYFNGNPTDCRYPRHLHDLRYVEHREIYQDIVYGESKYNQERIREFFRELYPEEFL